MPWGQLNLETTELTQILLQRRFVPPSFNDIRLILNTAQIMGLMSAGPLELATFDGDVTLYDDGQSLEPSNTVIKQIICQSPFHLRSSAKP